MLDCIHLWQLVWLKHLKVCPNAYVHAHPKTKQLALLFNFKVTQYILTLKFYLLFSVEEGEMRSPLKIQWKRNYGTGPVFTPTHNRPLLRPNHRHLTDGWKDGWIIEYIIHLSRILFGVSSIWVFHCFWAHAKYSWHKHKSRYHTVNAWACLLGAVNALRAIKCPTP